MMSSSSTDPASIGEKEAADATDVMNKASDEAIEKVEEASKPQLSQESLLALQREVQRARIQKRVMKGKEDLTIEHKFWSTQPVPAFTEAFEESGPIEKQRTVEEVKQDPYGMPAGFDWCTVDILDQGQAEEVYTLLTENYVEDDDNMFRFDYSVDFLQWALTVPGYHQDWHVGVRNIKTGKLLAFITGIPAHVRVHTEEMPMAEINFLCVHKKLRHKRLAPVLIKEITRRVNLRNIWQATYTAGVVLPKPVAKCRYWHRSINPKKLIEIGFTSLRDRMTLSQTIKHYRLPDNSTVPLEVLTREDIPSAHALLTNYLASKCRLVHKFSEEELAHMLLTRDNVVNSYCLKNAAGEVTDLISFYHLPSTVIGNPRHTNMGAAYSYYNVATTISWEILFKNALIMARKVGADVFNGLDLMDNLDAFKANLFGIGDGHLQYYVYNWKCPTIDAGDVGLVLL